MKGTYRILKIKAWSGRTVYQPQVYRENWLWRTLFGEWKDIGSWDIDGHFPKRYGERSRAEESCRNWEQRIYGRDKVMGVIDV
jgi:hypothetical protein